MSTHRSRYQFIAETLARHSLGFLAGVTGTDRFIPFHRGAFGHGRREEPYITPEHVRLTLEDRGPTFIKLGQLLSTRPDLVPPAYANELAKLQDDAPPVPVQEIRDAIRQELGAEPEELFSRFDAVRSCLFRHLDEEGISARVACRSSASALRARLFFFFLRALGGS